MFDEPGFREKMATLERRLEEVAALLATPEVINKRAEFMKLSREHSDLGPLVEGWLGYRKLRDDLASARALADADPEMRELAHEEIRALEAALPEREAALKLLLLPKDPNDAKNTIVEIRAGTCGDEAALFSRPPRAPRAG
jgi:peptide chain release factor 1